MSTTTEPTVTSTRRIFLETFDSFGLTTDDNRHALSAAADVLIEKLLLAQYTLVKVPE